MVNHITRVSLQPGEQGGDASVGGRASRTLLLQVRLQGGDCGANHLQEGVVGSLLLQLGGVHLLGQGREGSEGLEGEGAELVLHVAVGCFDVLVQVR
jgi:hypothetical protein